MESRVLGAVRFVDVNTGAPVPEPLELESLDGPARFVRNRTGLRVLTRWGPLDGHEASFPDPPAAPATGSLAMRLRVADPTGRYLPRRVTLALPRDPDPENEGEMDSLFTPLDVPLFPSPRVATGPNWAVLRASVTDADDGALLGGVLLLVRRNGDVVGRALTDGRGEALVGLVGIPTVTFGEDADDAVVVDEVAVTVQAVFDPDTGTRLASADLAAGRPPPVPFVDPDSLEQARDDLPGGEVSLAVSARRSRTLTIALDLA